MESERVEELHDIILNFEIPTAAEYSEPCQTSKMECFANIVNG